MQGGEHLPDVSVPAVHVGLREPGDAVFIVINTKSLRELLAPSLDTQDGYFLVDPENVLPLNANAVYPTELSYEKRSAEPPTAFHLEGGKAMTALSIPCSIGTAFRELLRSERRMYPVCLRLSFGSADPRHGGDGFLRR